MAKRPSRSSASNLAGENDRNIERRQRNEISVAKEIRSENESSNGVAAGVMAARRSGIVSHQSESEYQATKRRNQHQHKGKRK